MARHRVLLICSWDHRTSVIRGSLREHGIEAQLSRVDTEPGLRAALQRAPYDAVVLVRSTPGMAQDLVATQLLVQVPATPLIVVDEVLEIGLRVSQLLQKN